MTPASIRRFLPVFLGTLATLLLAGCSSAPNWYDSAYYKNGAIVTPEPPATVPVAGPTN